MDKVLKDTPFDDEYFAIRKLGEGSFGCVYLIEHKQSGQRYALKVADIPWYDQNAMREVNAMEAVGSSNAHVMKLHNYRYDDGKLYMLCEYCEGGDFDQLLANNPNGCDVKQLVALYGQLVDAMANIHQQRYVHRDLKPANILLKKPLGDGVDVRIGDLGLARIMENPKQVATWAGTAVYMAPEFGVAVPQYGEKADVWSLGVVMAQLASGDGVRSEKLQRGLLWYVQMFGGGKEWSQKNVDNYLDELKVRRPDLPEDVHKALKMMLVVDQDKRASMNDVLRLECIQEYLKEHKNELEEQKQNIEVQQEVVAQQDTVDELVQKYENINDQLGSSPLGVREPAQLDANIEEQVNRLNDPNMTKLAKMVANWQSLSRKVANASENDWIEVSPYDRKPLVEIKRGINDINMNDAYQPKALLFHNPGERDLVDKLQKMWSGAKNRFLAMFAKNGSFSQAVRSAGRKNEYVMPIRMERGECYYGIVRKQGMNFELREWVKDPYAMPTFNGKMYNLPPLMNIVIDATNVDNMRDINDQNVLAMPVTDSSAGCVIVDFPNHNQHALARVEWQREYTGLHARVVDWIEPSEFDGNVTGHVDADSLGVSIDSVPYHILTDSVDVEPLNRNPWFNECQVEKALCY